MITIVLARIRQLLAIKSRRVAGRLSYLLNIPCYKPAPEVFVAYEEIGYNPKLTPKEEPKETHRCNLDDNIPWRKVNGDK